MTTILNIVITQENLMGQELEAKDFLCCFNECDMSKIVSAEPCHSELNKERRRKNDTGR